MRFTAFPRPEWSLPVPVMLEQLWQLVRLQALPRCPSEMPSKTLLLIQSQREPGFPVHALWKMLSNSSGQTKVLSQFTASFSATQHITFLFFPLSYLGCHKLPALFEPTRELSPWLVAFGDGLPPPLEVIWPEGIPPCWRRPGPFLSAYGEAV